MMILLYLFLFYPVLNGLTQFPDAAADKMHPYYVSVAELEWSSSTKQVELSIKLYTDDFEEGLKKFSADKVDLVKGEEKQHKSSIEAYMKNHFQVNINGKKVILQCIGFETDQEATWCYFQGSTKEVPVSFNIVNSILYEVKKEQVNIIHIKQGAARKSFRLVNPETDLQWKPGS